MSDDDPFADLEDAPVFAAGQPAAAPAPQPVRETGPALTVEAEPRSTEQLQGRARLAEDRLAEVVEAYRTLKTDNEAFRDRTTRNIERRFEQRRESLLLKFIDILDNMDRALEAAQTAYADQSLLEGLILVRTQLLQTLQDEGLERIPVLGLPFDPHVSEAVATAPVDELDQNGIVVKELMRGYRLNGRVARPSRVVTAEYRAPEAASGAPGGEEEEAAVPELALADPVPADEPLVLDAAEDELDEPHLPEEALVEEAAAPEEPEMFDAELTLDDIISQADDSPSPPPLPKPPARRGS